jgi:hypothetical protein
MTKPNPKRGTPFIAKMYPVGPDELLLRILKENPNATEEDTWLLFRAEVLKNEDMRDACLRSFHVNATGRLERLMSRAESPQERAAMAEQKRAERRARVTKAFKRAKAVLILDHVMPNGLRLGDCTFGYASEVGGAFARLGAMGDPDAIIGQVLTEDAADAAVGEIGPDEAPRTRDGRGMRKAGWLGRWGVS